MKRKPALTHRYIPATVLAAFSATALLRAQENPDTPPASQPHARILHSRTIPLPGGNTLVVERAASPPRAVPAATSARAEVAPAPRPPLRAVLPAAPETRVLPVTVTRYPGGRSYLEWWPPGAAEPFAAWSNADFEPLCIEPEVELQPGSIRWLIFPICTSAPAPLAAPHLPADAPGFQLVKGSARDVLNISPVAALHKKYTDEAPGLRAAWLQRRQQQAAEKAAAAVPAAPATITVRLWKTPPQSRRATTSKGGRQ